jgi:hypothetical protein
MAGVEIDDVERMKRAIRSLRNMIRDKKELNRLLMGHYENNDPELEQCIIQALIDWNMSPPILSPVTLASHPNKHLLLQCAAIQALTSAGIWHSREHMPGSDGGTSADDHAKAGEYSGWIERFEAAYERKKSDQKTALNIAYAMGSMGVMSEYGARQSVYGEWW